MSLEKRKEQWNAIGRAAFDVAVIGGGINGAAIYHHLSAEGYRVLLVDKGDFAGATSQASAMMVWGSLPDLRRFSFIKVGRLCASRERLIREKSESVRPRAFRYLPTNDNGRNPLSAFAALYSYWLLGGGRRSIPRYRKEFNELSFLKREKFSYSFEYEEASVAPSDARFVLRWVLSQPHSFDRIALNYCNLQGGRYDAAAKLWRLELQDLILGEEAAASAKWVINAAGNWTDRLNRQFGIESPYKHVFAKGVFLGVKRPPEHLSPLMIETKEREGCMALTPWGPIALWGPTETRVTDLEQGFSVKSKDVRFLLKELNRHLVKPVSVEDIISLRCGVRPLVVHRSFSETQNTSSIPREYRVHPDKTLPWISIYGGKLTSCISLAESVISLLRLYLTPSAAPQMLSMSEKMEPEAEEFPNISEKVPSARWCAESEMCWGLEDYLRRRTNISQWIPRGGLGFQNENIRHLMNLAGVFNGNDESKVKAAVCSYKQKIEREFDDILMNAA
jgi:glycerol-3-phosphate dehydrogenase